MPLRAVSVWDRRFSQADFPARGSEAPGSTCHWELASELVHIGLIAMTADCDATVFGEMSFNVPTLGALYQDATWRLINERRRRLPERLRKDRRAGRAGQAS